MLPAREVDPLPAFLGRCDLRVLLCLERFDEGNVVNFRDGGLAFGAGVSDLFRGISTGGTEAIGTDTTRRVETTPGVPAGPPAPSLERSSDGLQLVAVGLHHVPGCKFEERQPRRPPQ